MTRVMKYLVYKTVRDFGLSTKYVQSVLSLVLASIRKKNVCVSVHFVGDRYMRRLNRDYRDKDTTTDVLAFAMADGMHFDKSDFGDIFISVPQIKRQAKAFKRTYKEECTRMLIHGTLHLAGYDHIKKRDYNIMIPLQERLLSKVLSK